MSETGTSAAPEKPPASMLTCCAPRHRLRQKRRDERLNPNTTTMQTQMPDMKLQTQRICLSAPCKRKTAML